MFTLKSLFIILRTPLYNIRTFTAPAALFFDFSMYKKKILKRLSISFNQTLCCIRLQTLLPTIFGHYTVLLEFIKENPLLFPVKFAHIHEAVVKRFPFVINYEISEKQVIVSAIFHVKQNPTKKRKRK